MREMKGDRAENGRKAVDLFAAHPAGYYDAILMGMRMPEMDGLEATRAIRAMERVDAKLMGYTSKIIYGSIVSVSFSILYP